jgi:hypothetical protein
MRSKCRARRSPGLVSESRADAPRLHRDVVSRRGVGLVDDHQILPKAARNVAPASTRKITAAAMTVIGNALRLRRVPV